MLGLTDFSPEDILEIRNRCKKSLYYVCKMLCNFKDITPATHYPIIRNLEEDTNRKLICVPRGTLKSSIASVAYPIWLLINNPNLRIYLDSEIYENSKNFVRQIKSILKSEDFQIIFGDYEGPVWNEGEIVISKRTSVTMKEASITAGGIGTTKVGQHYDVYILDDPNSPANSATHEQRKKVVDHYQYAQSILEKPHGIFVLIGTRYSEDDLIGWIIKNELGFANETAMRQSSFKDKGVYYV